ncbi:hypothetical protein [Methylocystis hirsuta]|uniref:Uncharacterized protein n=1 Tax=Methylocystis hirsuta TaxID=369798 RepID=A0A3M9XK94_9HYPH|nr:hypothetical protein [Methylocystis hirsuta]RNJ48693.1 hypothetical protein D1O30_02645 [Methylocystis hirsuta]
MNKVFVAIGLVASVIASCPAGAATIENIAGGIKVNRGSGFSAQTSPTDLAPGDRIMVSKGGSAHLLYADGCRMKLAQGVTTVPAASPCSFSAQFNDGAVGDTNPYLLAGGTVLLFGGGIAAAFALTGNGNGCTSAVIPLSGGTGVICQ